MRNEIRHTRILLHLCVLHFLCISTASFSQKETKQELYEFDMKYTGSSTDVSPNYQYILAYLVELMKKNPDWTLHVRGHVCCGPDQKLSDKRAKKVYNYLLDAGLSESRLTYKGYSDKKPLVFPEKTDEDAKQNRRVDFIINKPIH